MKINEIVGDADQEPVAFTILRVPEDVLTGAGLRLDESRWQHCRDTGLMVRVDPKRAEMKQLRHVHVADEKHIRTKGQQASWNDNLKRHDKGTFNTKLGAQPRYQNAARIALGLPKNAILEEVSPGEGLSKNLFESIDGFSPNAVFQYPKLSKARKLLTFVEFLRGK